MFGNIAFSKHMVLLEARKGFDRPADPRLAGTGAPPGTADPGPPRPQPRPGVGRNCEGPSRVPTWPFIKRPLCTPHGGLTEKNSSSLSGRCLRSEADAVSQVHTQADGPEGTAL